MWEPIAARKLQFGKYERFEVEPDRRKGGCQWLSRSGHSRHQRRIGVDVGRACRSRTQSTGGRAKSDQGSAPSDHGQTSSRSWGQVIRVIATIAMGLCVVRQLAFARSKGNRLVIRGRPGTGRRVVDAMRRIVDLKALIERLERDGHDASGAMNLLVIFENSLKLMIDYRDQLAKTLRG